MKMTLQGRIVEAHRGHLYLMSCDRILPLEGIRDARAGEYVRVEGRVLFNQDNDPTLHVEKTERL